MPGNFTRALGVKLYVGYPTKRVNSDFTFVSGEMMTRSAPKRVLIADDSYSMRKAIRRFFDEQTEVEVCAVTSNGVEAVDAALALKPDLLIIDAIMPGLNGIEVAGVLKKSLPRSKFILFTMYGDTVGKSLAKYTGLDVVVPKSEGLAVLAEKINTAVEEIGD